MSGTGKKRRRKIVYRKKSQNRAGMMLAITVMMVILVAVTVRGMSLRQKLSEYNQKKEQLQNGIASEEERSRQIEEYSKYTQTDEYVEEVARDKLGLVKEGETVFRREENSASENSASSGENSASDSSVEESTADTPESGQAGDAAAGMP